MKSSKIRVVTLTLLTFFFLCIPFIQSFFFSSKSKGTIKINQEISADYIQSDKRFILLFFGYVGCDDVCSPFLMKLSKLYDSKEFDPIRENIDVLFINLRPEVEEFQVDLFANYFNNKFRGIYLSKKEIFNIDRKFALFFSQDLSEKTELNHTDYLYLISNENKTLNLQNIYSTHPLLNRQLVNDIIRLR